MKLFSIGDDDPLPEYKICHEKIGSGRKLWTIRENKGEKKLVTAMGSKKEASQWIDVCKCRVEYSEEGANWHRREMGRRFRT